jgi:hypothetical protein
MEPIAYDQYRIPFPMTVSSLPVTRDVRVERAD